jgi:hypothetical protein
MKLFSLLHFTLLGLLGSCSTLALNFRGSQYQREDQVLKSSYLVRTYSVSLDAGQTASPVNVSSACVTNAISSLVQSWSHGSYPSETAVAFSPPFVCKRDGNWTIPTNWTLPESRRLAVAKNKCVYFCFTQCVMNCLLCGFRRTQQSHSGSSNVDVYYGLEQRIKSSLPVMCPGINIIYVNVTIDVSSSAASSDAFKTLTNWTRIHGH